MTFPVSFHLHVCSDSVEASRASFAALSKALAAAPLSDALADRLRALAPAGQAAADLIRISYEAFRHGAVGLAEARLVPGDAYLDFVAELLAERPGLHVRHTHGWPILFVRPLAALPVGGAGAA